MVQRVRLLLADVLDANVHHLDRVLRRSPPRDGFGDHLHRHLVFDAVIGADAHREPEASCLKHDAHERRIVLVVHLRERRVGALIADLLGDAMDHHRGYHCSWVHLHRHCRSSWTQHRHSRTHHHRFRMMESSPSEFAVVVRLIAYVP